MNWFKKIADSSFIRQLLVVATGTAAAQAITMALAPFVARLYGPEAFGIMGTFGAILSVMIPIASFCYPVAIVLPREDTEAAGVARLSLNIAIFMSAMATLLLLLQSPLLKTLNIDDIEEFIWLLPPGMLFASILAVASQWAIRQKLFNLIAKVAILQALWLNTTKVVIGLVAPHATSLLVLSTAGAAIHTLMLYVGFRKNSDSPNAPVKCFKFSFQEKCTSPMKLAWRYREFAYYRTPQVLLNAISQNLPILFLAGFAAPAAAGYFTLSKSMLGMPAALIGQAFASVFYPRVNEAALQGEDVGALIVKATCALAIVGAIPFGIVIVFGVKLFTLVFGQEWLTAGEYARWLALWLYFGFVNRASVVAIPVLALQGFFLAYEIASILLRTGALLLGFLLLGEPLVAVALFCVVGAFLNFALVLAVMIFIKLGVRKSR